MIADALRVWTEQWENEECEISPYLYTFDSLKQGEAKKFELKVM